MNGLQIGVLVLIIAAFALGWWAARADTARGVAVGDDAGRPDRDAALLAADAALAMWRVERGRLSPAARRSMMTAAGRLRSLLPSAEEPGDVEPSAVRALVRAFEDAALEGAAPPAPPPVVEAARAILGDGRFSGERRGAARDGA